MWSSLTNPKALLLCALAQALLCPILEYFAGGVEVGGDLSFWLLLWAVRLLGWGASWLAAAELLGRCWRRPVVSGFASMERPLTLLLLVGATLGGGSGRANAWAWVGAISVCLLALAVFGDLSTRTSRPGQWVRLWLWMLPFAAGLHSAWNGWGAEWRLGRAFTQAGTAVGALGREFGVVIVLALVAERYITRQQRWRWSVAAGALVAFIVVQLLGDASGDLPVHLLRHLGLLMYESWWRLAAMVASTLAVLPLPGEAPVEIRRRQGLSLIIAAGWGWTQPWQQLLTAVGLLRWRDVTGDESA